LTREEVYDAKVAPLMGKVIALCKEHDIPLFADFYLDMDAEMRCTTVVDANESGGVQWRLYRYLGMGSVGNIDGFLLNVMRDAKAHGHGSVFLKLLEQQGF